MRPILWDVDANADPPTMTICFVGRPHDFVTLPIRETVATADDALRAAVRELDVIIALRDQIAARAPAP